MARIKKDNFHGSYRVTGLENDIYEAHPSRRCHACFGIIKMVELFCFFVGVHHGFLSLVCTRSGTEQLSRQHPTDLPARLPAVELTALPTPEDS